MVRRLLGVALVVAGVSQAGAAWATIPTNAGKLAFEVRIPDPNVLPPTKTHWVKPATTDALHYFNLPRCVCSQANVGDRFASYAFHVTQMGMSLPSDLSGKAVELWAGPDCDQTTSRTASCKQLGSLDSYDIFYTPQDIEFSVFDTIQAAATGGCVEQSGDAPVWLLVKPDGATYESVGSQTVAYDNKPPPLPTNITVNGSEGGIKFTFTQPAAASSEVLYYQALCSLASDETTPGRARSHDRQYDTFHSLCGLPLAPTLDQRHIDPTQNVTPDAGLADAGLPDAGTTDAAVAAAPLAMPAGPPPTLDSLDESFICGQAASTATELQVEGLTNGVAYHVILLAVDKARNEAGVKFIEPVTPQAVTDFWEDGHDQGSQVEGGFCLLADTYGDGGPITRALRAFRDDTLASSLVGRALTRFYYNHVAWLGEYVAAWWPLRIVAAIALLPLVVFALAWHLLTLPGLLLLLGLGTLLWRRRMRVRTARLAVAGAAVTLAMLHTTVAHAQSTTPYWDDPDFGTEPTGPTESHWIIGLKLGPYVPPIDAQFQRQTGKTTRPYHEMFGGYNIVPELEVDRILWRGFGQVTVGGLIGFLGKSANAFVDGSKPGEANRQRSPGDTTSFRLMPMAATATYRLTYFDDRYGVPIIPYLRAGLSYYMWWVRQPSGALADITSRNCHAPMGKTCTTENKAIGATAGVQASIGIAVRAERIDSDAAASMAESGIEHAGFYVEYQAAKVDGFGKDTKLAVGDSTWFAGINFEF